MFACFEQQVMLDSFLNIPQSYLLIQGLSLSLDLTDSVGLAGQQTLSVSAFSLLRLQVCTSTFQTLLPFRISFRKTGVECIPYLKDQLSWYQDTMQASKSRKQPIILPNYEPHQWSAYYNNLMETVRHLHCGSNQLLSYWS